MAGYVPGVRGAGAVWAAAWLLWYRNRPEDHAGVTAVELAEIRQGAAPPPAPRIEWGRLARSGNLWALCAMYSGYTYGLYFYLTWLPTYLARHRGLPWTGVGIGAALPLLAGAGANVAGGYLTDRLTRRIGRRWGRRLPAVSGLLAAGLLLAVAALARNNVVALAAFALSFGAGDLILAACWATCIDLGRQNAGTIAGAMNSLGQLGGVLSPYLLGWLLEEWGSWTIPLLLSAGYYVVSAALWLLIDPEDDRLAS